MKVRKKELLSNFSQSTLPEIFLYYQILLSTLFLLLCTNLLYQTRELVYFQQYWDAQHIEKAGKIMSLKFDDHYKNKLKITNQIMKRTPKGNCGQKKQKCNLLTDTGHFAVHVLTRWVLTVLTQIRISITARLPLRQNPQVLNYIKIGMLDVTSNLLNFITNENDERKNYATHACHIKNHRIRQEENFSC